jgi:hypothetical protein
MPFHPPPVPLPRRLLRLPAALLLCAGLAGCASWAFTPLRESRFVNIDAEVLRVEYGKETRTETLPGGLVCTYGGKVRLTLPDGSRAVLYETIAASGLRYQSADKRLEFREKAPRCMVLSDDAIVFEGLFCR